MLSGESTSITSRHNHPRRQALHELLVPRFEVVHFPQNGHAVIDSQRPDIVQVLPVELVENAISRLRIGQSFQGSSPVHLL